MKALILIFFYLAIIPFFGTTQNDQIKLYTLGKTTKGSGKEVSFVSLTHHQWAVENRNTVDFKAIRRDSKDSAVITNEYLGDVNVNKETRNYHKLTSENRKRFLRRRGIAGNDSIFYYHAGVDTLIGYSVKSQPLVAKLMYYINDPPIEESDYQVGFEFENIEINESGVSMVYIGKGHPFIRDEVQRIDWKKVPQKRFPSQYNDTIKNNENYRKGERDDTYVFRTSGYEYYVQNIVKDDRVFGRHLIVKDSETDTIVFNKGYFSSESKVLLNLGGQWTGKLFKNKPPIITGFLGRHYGCPTLYFLDKSNSTIFISCDNRS